MKRVVKKLKILHNQLINRELILFAFFHLCFRSESEREEKKESVRTFHGAEDSNCYNEFEEEEEESSEKDGEESKKQFSFKHEYITNMKLIRKLYEDEDLLSVKCLFPIFLINLA